MAVKWKERVLLLDKEEFRYEDTFVSFDAVEI
jgi:hypothetical protein